MAPPFVTLPQNPVTANTFIGNTPGPGFAVGPAGMTGFQVSETVLSSAQLLALFTGAITLIPAPGVGFFLNIDKIVMRLLAGSAAYTDAGGAVSFTVGSLTVALASNAIFLVTTSPNRRIQVVDFAAAAAGTGVTGTAGNPPTEDNGAFTISKATGNLAAGNGTMKITTYYTTETSL
ncbi:MAG: hypothetical protein HRJ53_29520 [Acidobacteria bacterium Pan2503]|uniref:Uncharacterized protein n=1 Tax=Candidatus Acidiferrum panamense TaxID=2741543 RepID=A0A7V8NX74_9BACT|nr:hypothetical protein [Candidatus Acidoferrum panamensis]